MPVDTKHPDYDVALPDWQMCEDASNGERAIHGKGVAYLPKLHEEKTSDYEARKARTPFFNATWRTISGMKGLIFRKPAQVKVPTPIIPYLDNIDATGRPLNLFAQAAVEQVLKVGRAGILVDYPPMPLDEDGRPLSVAQAEAMGLRPYLTMYNARSIINWRTAKTNNAEVLTMVVLCESAEVPGKDEFDLKTEDRYRVLDIAKGFYRQRVYRKDAKGDDELVSENFPMMRGAPIREIPFVFLGVDDLKSSIDTPPMLDLVRMNLHHYRVGSDYEHGCHFSGLPTLFVTGVQTDVTIYIGGAAANVLPDPTSQAFYAETSGNFEGLRQNLDGKKAEMAVLGARFLENQKSQVEAADTIRQRVNGENSVLAAMANVISMGIAKALRIMADWSGASGDVMYQLNTDYLPAGLSSDELTALVTSWQAGAMSFQTMYDNLQRGEIASQEVTAEEEQERIKSQPVPGQELTLE